MTYRSTATAWIVWAYTDPMWANTDISGYKVEALDGEIGKVDHATMEMDKSYLVANVGSWLIGKKVMLPAGVVSRIDQEDKRVFVNRTKEQIKNAPEFDESYLRDAGYYDRLGKYYSEGSPGWREPVTY